jgi:hypothetical protein
MKRAAAEYRGRIDYTEVDTSDTEAFAEWGISDAIYIDDKQINTGPPPSYEKLRRLLCKKAGTP